MKIDALKYLSDKDKNSPVPCSLEISSPSDIDKLQNDKIPHAYVVKASCLGTFRQYRDKIDDRGSKDKRESLYRKMEHAHTISIIHAANYKKSKKLSSGVCKLLENIVKKNNFNLCVIGAPDALFDELFKEAAGRPRSKLNKTGSQAPGDGSAEGFKFPDTIMRLMDNVVVPADLEQKYLGSSKEAEFVRRLILLAAKNDTPVLIVGATGTGKEVVARQIHDCSERSGLMPGLSLTLHLSLTESSCLSTAAQ